MTINEAKKVLKHLDAAWLVAQKSKASRLLSEIEAARSVVYKLQSNDICPRCKSYLVTGNISEHSEDCDHLY